jgi:hypothetical protein
MIRLIGDIHGKIHDWKVICGATEHPTVQIGDFGFGFITTPEFNVKDRFIRGNHDNPDLCRRHRQHIPDGKVEGEIMYVGGAWSIDWMHRKEGVSWWRDEQLSYSQFHDVINTYEDKRPRVMVTHDCPNSAVDHLFPWATPIPSVTSSAFDAMLDIHTPELWIFGH